MGAGNRLLRNVAASAGSCSPTDPIGQPAYAAAAFRSGLPTSSQPTSSRITDQRLKR
jgi:hypothetical protein